MFLHTHKTISKLFNSYADRISELRPINLLGPQGLGKLFYIKEFIRHFQCGKYKPFLDINSIYWQKCDCRICQNIINNQAVDICIFKGNEKIEEVRNKLNDFVDSFSVEYEYRFLIVQNLQMFSNHELDLFLNVFEEPPDYIKIFTTSINLDGVSNPIESRLQSFEVNQFSKEGLKIVLGGTSELESYVSILDKYDFKTIHQLIYYSKFTFEDMFLKLFSKVNNSYSIEVELMGFLKLVEEQNDFQLNEVIKFFMEFCIVRIYEFCNLNQDNIKITCLKGFIQDKIIPIFSLSLFKYINISKQYHINIKYQMFMFFNIIFMLRKIIGV